MLKMKKASRQHVSGRRRMRRWIIGIVTVGVVAAGLFFGGKLAYRWYESLNGQPLSVTYSKKSPTEAKKLSLPQLYGDVDVKYKHISSPILAGHDAQLAFTTSASASCAIKIMSYNGQAVKGPGLSAKEADSDTGVVAWTWHVGSDMSGTFIVTARCSNRGESAHLTKTVIVK